MNLFYDKGSEDYTSVWDYTPVWQHAPNHSHAIPINGIQASNGYGWLSNTNTINYIPPREPGVYGPDYTIPKNTKALIRDFTMYNRSKSWIDSWFEIKTTHPNIFRHLDIYTVADQHIKGLALMYGEGVHPHDLKIFFKDNWLFCCRV